MTDTKKPTSPSPADQADMISGGPNPYPVGEAEHALQDALDQIDHVGAANEQPSDVEDEQKPSDLDLDED